MLLARNIPRFAAIIWLGVLYCLISSCAPEQPPPSTATVIAPASSPATLSCEQELIPPQIIEVRPAEPSAGSEVKVIGSGGYIRDSCGGYMEGARDFKLHLDHEPIGALSCYVNHCEGTFTLPGRFAAGSHCLSMEADLCEFEFQVAGQ
jgi:hypothetical protein